MTDISVQEFVKQINQLRRNNKNKWYYFLDTVEGKKVQLKGYNTWLQIYKVNGIDYSNCMDGTVKQFNTTLIKPFEVSNYADI